MAERQNITSAFEEFFTKEYGVTFIDITPKVLCTETINCGRTGWLDGEMYCEGCGIERFTEEQE